MPTQQSNGNLNPEPIDGNNPPPTAPRAPLPQRSKRLILTSPLEKGGGDNGAIETAGGETLPPGPRPAATLA